MRNAHIHYIAAATGAWTVMAPFFFGSPSMVVVWSNVATGTAIVLYALWRVYGSDR